MSHKKTGKCDVPPGSLRTERPQQLQIFVSLAEEVSLKSLEKAQVAVCGFQVRCLKGELSEWKEMLCVSQALG